MISVKAFLVAFCAACALVVLAAAESKHDIVNIDPLKCKDLSKGQTCLSCCQQGGFNGYDDKRSFGCLCMQFSGDISEITSLSEVMKAETGN